MEFPFDLGIGESVANIGLELAGHEMPPGISNVVSGVQALYHGGSAVYDAAHGDRDGAINHGMHALFNGACAIPVVGNALSVANQVGAVAGTAGRIITAAAGGDSEECPGDIGDLLSSNAVGMTNAVFGADTDNFIADGDRPNGTRAGEIEAGLDAATLGLFAESTGDWSRSLAGEPAENAFVPMDYEPRPTSGVEPGVFAEAGQWAHERLGSPLAGAAEGALLLGGTMPLNPMAWVAGAAGGYAVGQLDEYLDRRTSARHAGTEGRGGF